MNFVELTNNSARASLLIAGSMLLLGLANSGCSSTAASDLIFQNRQTSFLSSGTIIISHAAPQISLDRARLNSDYAGSSNYFGKIPFSETRELDFDSLALATPTAIPAGGFSPLIGYFPPVSAYVPADNETWLEISAKSNKVLLHKGKSVIKEIQAEGKVSINEGKYYLHHKQKQPLWYAPDQYFADRQLDIPRPGDRMRYRKGALGKYALYPTTTFPIHCGAVWSEDVGGLRLSASDLTSIYYMLPVGATIVVSQ